MIMSARRRPLGTGPHPVTDGSEERAPRPLPDIERVTAPADSHNGEPGEPTPRRTLGNGPAREA